MVQFRRQAVQQAARGGRYDAPEVGIPLRRWSAIFAALVIAASAIAWAFLAEIPITVESKGILLHPSGVRPVEATQYGVALTPRVSRNQRVTTGSILLELALPDLQDELRLAESALRVLENADADARRIEADTLQQERELANKKRASLEKTLTSLQAIVDRNRTLSSALMQEQATRLEDLLADSTNLLHQLETQLTAVSQLADRDLATATDTARATSQVLESTRAVAGLNDQKNNLQLQQLRTEQSILEVERQIEELRLGIQELQTSLTRAENKVAVEQGQREAQLQRQRDTITSLQDRLKRQRFVRSPCEGTLLEVPVAEGQPIRPGQTIATIARQPETDQEKLQVTAFFPLASGKRIAPGATAFVTPSTVPRERYGSIIATVEDVYDFPISAEEAVRIVGSREVLKPLMNVGGVLGIRATPQPSPQAGAQFEWTSSRQAPQLTAGTSVSLRVVVERRKPISYLLPFLRRSFYGPDRSAEPQP